LEWKRLSETRWTATGSTGTEWEVRKSAEDSYGVIVACWDWPDWYSDSLEGAKDIAAERDVAPPIPPEEWLDEEP
jgi:hypothetical protein